MYVKEIIFSNFQGKYENIKIKYIYNFKIFVNKNLLRIICKKKNILNWQWKIVRNFLRS